MATTAKLTTTRPAEDGGKKVTKKLSHVNPNVSKDNLAMFAGALNSLSKNTDLEIEKINKRELAIPQL